MPLVRMVDLNRANVVDGMAIPLLKAIERRLERSEQSLIFINRRGFAPLVFCHDCKWFATCEHCDVRMIFHATEKRIRCHRCGAHGGAMPKFCPNCDSPRVELVGEGTQKIERALRKRFAGARVLRIDSDSTKGYREIQKTLDRAQRGDADILVGTQMLSKGHNFPYVTLVGVLDADRGFYSIDFRALEYLTQQVLQVAGRAGRMEKPGKVLIQSMNADNEIFKAICSHDYMSFARHELAQRNEAQHPPFVHQALLRANSLKAEDPVKFLADARSQALQLLSHGKFEGVRVRDAVPSPIGKLSNRHRAQLLATGTDATLLKKFLGAWLESLENTRKQAGLRWNVDVDPMDFL